MATIHYLNWHSELSGEQDPAPAEARAAPERDAYFGFHTLLSDRTNPLTVPQDYYQTVADVAHIPPEEVFKQWNRGSGSESETFEDAATRSMSIGDIIEYDKTLLAVTPVGFIKAEWGDTVDPRIQSTGQQSETPPAEGDDHDDADPHPLL